MKKSFTVTPDPDGKHGSMPRAKARKAPNKDSKMGVGTGATYGKKGGMSGNIPLYGKSRDATSL